MKFYKPFKPDALEHVTIYRHEHEFCSWPFNAGMWKISADNIRVGFMNIACDYSIPENMSHNRVESYGRIATVRTRDMGRTWSTPVTMVNNGELSAQLKFGKQAAYTKSHDFSDPNTLLSCWSTPNSGDSQAKAWIKISNDGGENWGPSVLLPNCKIPRFQGRPSYIVRPDGVILLFLTARPATNHHDRPVVYASFDGGSNWALISIMPGSTEYRMICPSPVMFNDGLIVVSVRCKLTSEGVWDEIYESEDGGRTWKFVSRVNDHGDTAHLTLMEDGRLLCVYGYRRPPFGIRARISEDRGKTWSPEMILRDDGGCEDLGYPRSVELGNGEVLTAYYFNDLSDYPAAKSGSRYIAGTIFKV